jgi:hypothetical protein
MIRGQSLGDFGWQFSFFAQGEASGFNCLFSGKGYALMLQARVSAEVHKQTQFIPASVKVVQDLGAVLGQKRRDGFELHNDRFVAQEVGAETVVSSQ